MSRPKITYDIARLDTGEILSQHRTRQAAIDNWRLRHTGIAIRIWRRGRRTDGEGVLVVEGTWHEAIRPDGA
jgi:hypothetical protein